MNRWLQKKYIIGAIIVVVGFGIWYRTTHTSGPTYETTPVTRGAIRRLVTVTGQVKSTAQADLAMERGGKVAFVGPKVGDMVKAGDTLVRLSNADVVADWRQAQARVIAAEATADQFAAALLGAEATLQQLQSGTRLEDLAIAEARVTNAHLAVADAEQALTRARDTATVGLTNLYDSIPQLVADADATVDAVAHTYLDALFTNDDTSNPQLSFAVADSNAKIAAENARLTLGTYIQTIRARIAVATGVTGAGRDQALSATIQDLGHVRDLLSLFPSVVDTATTLSATTAATYKADISTARSSVNIRVGTLRTHEQDITVKKSTNAQAVKTAETALHAAEQARTVAERELTLKRAGATAGDIAAEEAEVARSRAALKSQKAQVAIAQAAVQAAAAQVEKTILRAPTTGVVTSRDVEVGEIVPANQTILSLMPEAALTVEAFIPEVDSPRVKVGQRAQITVDAYSDTVALEATVAHLDPAATVIDGVSTYRALLDVTEPDARLKSGMTATIQITTDSREDVVAVPVRALTTTGATTTVQILRGTEPTPVPVTVGIYGSDGQVEILSGVEVGDMVIVGHIQ